MSKSVEEYLEVTDLSWEILPDVTSKDCLIFRGGTVNKSLGSEEEIEKLF